MNVPTLNTERLILKALADSDAQSLLAYRSDPEIFRYQSWKPTALEEARDFITRYTQSFDQEGTWFQLGIFERNSMVLIGDLGLHFVDDAQVEIGFTIAGAHHRKGYGREAVWSVIDYLFGVMKKHRVTASVDPANLASIALLKSVGMRQEAHFKKSILIDGRWEDDLQFAILEEEWMK